jgi:hypothetical protein
MALIFRRETQHPGRGDAAVSTGQEALLPIGVARGDTFLRQCGSLVGTLTPCATSTIVRAMTGHNHIFGICREIIS